MQVAAQLTPAGAPAVAAAFVAAYRALTGREPVSRSSWLMPVAQSALETGQWSAMRNWNAGFITQPSRSMPYFIIGSNPNPFAAYASLQDGVGAMMGWLVKHGTIAYADNNDLAGYVASLQASDYVGSEPSVYPQYETGIAALMRQFANLQPAAYAPTWTTARALGIGLAVVGASVIAAQLISTGAAQTFEAAVVGLKITPYALAVASGAALVAVSFIGLRRLAAVPLGLRLLARARTDLGISESSDPSRIAQMLANYGIQGNADWCAAALGTWLREAAAPNAPPIPGSAGAKTTMTQFQDIGQWIDAADLQKNSNIVQPGMVAVWQRGPANTWTGHIGVVSKNLGGGKFSSVEGNTAGGRVALNSHAVTDSNLLGMGYLGQS